MVSGKKYILAIDQGTTGTRAYVFDAKAQVVSSAYKEFEQYFPKPGWVEHDAEEIWDVTCQVIKKALKMGKAASSAICAIGITNQRETTVLWDKTTGKPVHKAIVWQCRRTTELCEKLMKHTPIIRKKTGLVLDPYFSATKIKWILDKNKTARKKANQGQVLFGTIDAWLIYKLTNGASHVTDRTNASRTLLYNIQTHQWDSQLCKIFDVPPDVLPKVQHSGSIFGYTAKTKSGLKEGIPISAVLGDQQAALYGQGCFDEGSVKNTYGTGCFLVLNKGKKCVISKENLLTTVAANYKGEPVYALEGSIFIAGAVVQWLRDKLKILTSAEETEAFIKGISSTGGVYFVPAFVGLGAPYWDSQAKGLITGLTRGSTDQHIVRAALESMAYQTRDVFDCMQKDIKKSIKEIRVDGGACQNHFLMQFQADLLNAKVVRPEQIDSTALGAALLAGFTIGLWSARKELDALLKQEKTFSPKMKSLERESLYTGWRQAVKQAQTR